MDTAGQEMTLDTFLSWKIEALREYLGKRGLVKDKPKQELAALAFSAHLLKLPVVPSATDSLKKNVMQYRNLLVTGDTTIPDPLSLHDGWMDEKSGIGHWPPIFLSDIIEYAGVADSNINIHRFLQQYKLGKGQSFIDSGHAKEIFLHNITATSRYCILRSECTPSQHLKDDSHKLWICASKETGNIKSSYCTCTAGLGSACIHVTAALFRVETAHRLGVSSCTSMPCTWQTPSIKTDHKPAKLKNLKIAKPQHGALKSKKRPLVADIKATFQPLDDQDKEECLATFASSLRKSLPNACLFKGLDTCEAPANTDRSRIEAAVDVNEYSIENMTKKGLTGPATTPISKEAVEGINKATIGQHMNENWHVIREGRITSSNFHSVKTKVHNKESTSLRTHSLLSNIMGYTSVNPNLKPLKHGRQMEPVARKEYIKMCSKMHKDTISTQCGIYVECVRPYLAASPDLLVSCSCCGNGLAEFKCPLIPKCDICESLCKCKLPTCLKLESGSLRLKQNHGYYYQIQGQMGIVGRSWCDFFVYTCNGIFCERIQFDQAFYEELLADLDYFFTKYILQEMSSRALKNTLSGTSEEPMEVDTPPTGNVFFCPICKKVVEDNVTSYRSQSVQCDLCDLWYHFPCANMTKALVSKVKSWKCSKCSNRKPTTKS